MGRDFMLRSSAGRRKDEPFEELVFSGENRDNTSISRIGFVASLLTRSKVARTESAISPLEEARDKVRRDAGKDFTEIFVDAQLEACVASRECAECFSRFRIRLPLACQVAQRRQPHSTQNMPHDPCAQPRRFHIIAVDLEIVVEESRRKEAKAMKHCLVEG